MRKRLLTIGLATLMAISITDCGGNSKKDESKSTTTTAKKLTTEEKIKKLKGQPVDKTIKKLKQYGYKGEYSADGVDFTDFIDDFKDDYLTGKVEIDKDSKTVKIELVLASNKKAKSDEKNLESKLEKGASWTAVKHYGEDKYGKDFKLHYLKGKITESMDDKNTWFLKAECTLNGEKKTCEAKVSGLTDNPTVKSFDIY